MRALNVAVEPQKPRDKPERVTDGQVAITRMQWARTTIVSDPECFGHGSAGGALFYPGPVCRPAPKVGLDGSTFPPFGRQIMHTDRAPRKLHKEREAEPAPRITNETRYQKLAGHYSAYSSTRPPPPRAPLPPPIHPYCPNFLPPVEPLSRRGCFARSLGQLGYTSP